MTIQSFAEQLQSKLSSNAKVLTRAEDEEFKQLLLRWSDINRKTPGAIVLVGTESDVVTAVKAAVEAGVPFVPASGGHSLWSTIGEEGFILDLRRLTNISVDAESRRITLQSGVLVKQANDTAWEHGLCLPLGTANSAGAVPMALGGGLSAFSSIMGTASDNILSAKVVTADGRLVTASATSNPDLLYGLRGAGQFFGVVTEVTFQAHPVSVIGTPDGSVWTGVMVFPIEKADAVFETLSTLVEDTKAPTTGICIISSPPPTFATSLIVIPVYFGGSADAERFYKPLIDLGPFSTCQSVPYPRINDSGEAFCIKGGFKRFAGASVPKIDPKTWKKIIVRYEELTKERPDAKATGYGVEWNTYDSGRLLEETAFSHHNVKIWAEFLSWYSDAASHEAISRAEQDVIALAREGQEKNEYRSYQNWSRDGPIEYLYDGQLRQEKLKALKRQWDPTGVFTRLFLD